jgi:cobalt-zinc-cadmium efflux system protein
MTATPAIHPHVPARTVLIALVVTLLAAGIELAGARRSGSLFLAADAVHLVAHLGIFLVLLIPTATWHELGDDFVTNAVLILILLIALGIARPSVEQLSVALHEPPRPTFMLLSLLGLGANLTTAYLFRSPAKTRWSFRAALAHELSDAALTVAGLFGALAIKLYGFRWVDPGLSLVIALWLSFWSLRLLARRACIGRVAWTENRGAS